jgi:hypothetical protein
MNKYDTWIRYINGIDEKEAKKVLNYTYGKRSDECEHKVSYSDHYDRNRFEKDIAPKRPEIKRVVFNEPATIVFWSDNTKTVVKCQDGDIYDPEKGLAMAIAKKYLGNKGSYCNEFKKWLPEEKEGESNAE